jgi:hypothetical protein
LRNRPAAAGEWAWRMPFANISWFSPEPIREDMREALAKQVAADTKSVGFAPEPYAFGKQVCLCVWMCVCVCLNQVETSHKKKAKQNKMHH